MVARTSLRMPLAEAGIVWMVMIEMNVLLWGAHHSSPGGTRERRMEEELLERRFRGLEIHRIEPRCRVGVEEDSPSGFGVRSVGAVSISASKRCVGEWDCEWACHAWGDGVEQG